MIIFHYYPTILYPTFPLIFLVASLGLTYLDEDWNDFLCFIDRFCLDSSYVLILLGLKIVNPDFMPTWSRQPSCPPVLLKGLVGLESNLALMKLDGFFCCLRKPFCVLLFIIFDFPTAAPPVFGLAVKEPYY